MEVLFCEVDGGLPGPEVSGAGGGAALGACSGGGAVLRD